MNGEITKRKKKKTEGTTQEREPVKTKSAFVQYTIRSFAHILSMLPFLGPFLVSTLSVELALQGSSDSFFPRF